jgi:hypothetical protein
MPDFDMGGGGDQGAAYENAAATQAAAARETAQMQLQAARESNALIKEMYQTGRADLAPWRAQGQMAMDVYGGLLGLPSIYSTQFPTVPGQEYPKTSNDTTKTTETTGAIGTTGTSGNVLLGGGGYTYDPEMGVWTPYKKDQTFYQDSYGNLYPSAMIQKYPKYGNVFEQISGAKPTGYTYIATAKDGTQMEVTPASSGPVSPTATFQGSTSTGGTTNTNANILANYEKSISSPSTRMDATEWVKRTPGYGFQFQEGLNALDRSAASRGMLLSGAQTRGAQEYGQNFALGHYNTLMDRLANMAGLGQSTAAQGAQSGQNMAAQSAANTMAGAQGAGQANMAGAQAIGSGYINAANAAAQNQQNSWNNLFSIGGLALGAAKLFGLSDKRAKTNIGPMPHINIDDLQPVSFDYRPEFGGSHQLGFVADDLLNVIPEAVIDGPGGLKQVAIMPIVAALCQALQDQGKEIEDLRSKVNVQL